MMQFRNEHTIAGYGRFLSKLSGWKLASYSDRGAVDLNRAKKRARGKAQRAARRRAR